MSERSEPALPAESAGAAPGRGRLAGRRLLVVGAGQNSYSLPDPPIGNGRAISILCAREGAAVVAADRDGESVSATVATITAEGGRAVAMTADISRPDEIERMVTAAHDAFGGLDGVVYNVGIAAGRGLAGSTPDVWDEVLNVNVRGAMLVARAALPVLDDGGSIVFVSSVAGIKPGSRFPAYDSSKAAIGGLMRHVALEGERRRIRVNVVAPGLMDTSLGRIASVGRPSRDRAPIPLGRQGTGWETAYAALFLLSGEAAYITGQTLVVDGGLTSLR
ncbi:MAG: SDR family oxidoreductase [Actinomycetota bacterium]|nr:SDR family oxidoreductase [Actinomycetota bacterium]